MKAIKFILITLIQIYASMFGFNADSGAKKEEIIEPPKQEIPCKNDLNKLVVCKIPENAFITSCPNNEVIIEVTDSMVDKILLLSPEPQDFTACPR